MPKQRRLSAAQRQWCRFAAERSRVRLEKKMPARCCNTERARQMGSAK